MRVAIVLQVDPGKEFVCGVTQLMKQKGLKIRRGKAGNHRAQGIVESMNRTLAERLFPYQYAQEMAIGQRERGARSTEWLRELRPVLYSMNKSETRLFVKKPADAIKLRRVWPVWRSGQSVGLGIERSRVRNSLVPSGSSLRQGN